MNRIARYCLPLVVASGVGPAAAQDASSAYTKLDVRRDCTRRPGKAVEDYGDWRCKGYAGMPMWLGAGDQRMYVSFGSKAKDEPAAAETLAPFNDFYKGVVEWRLANGKPFAAIMRWNVKRAADMENREVRGRALIVTRLPPGGVCHRWQIELFFRWIKQTLKIRHFLGRGENAVRIQLAVALIAFLLLRLAQEAQSAAQSPLAFARLISANLMHRRSIDRLSEPAPATIRCNDQFNLNLGQC